MQIMHNQKLYTITFVEVRQFQNLPLKPICTSKTLTYLKI